MSQEYDRNQDRRRTGSPPPSRLQGGSQPPPSYRSQPPRQPPPPPRQPPRQATPPRQAPPPSRQQLPTGQEKPVRRRKKKTTPLGVLLYLVFVLGLSALLAGLGWVAANDVLALNKIPMDVVIEINEGASTKDVAALLKDNGIIQYKSLFNLFVSVTHAQEKISPGTYELSTDMDYHAIITSISKNSPNRSVAQVTITEGMTVDQIFAMLEEKGVSTKAKLQEEAANHKFKYSFLADLPTGDYHRLEGYLFPDTYNFYMGGDALQILNKMILRFDERFTDEMRAEAEKSGYSVADIVTIASMIEKETDGDDQADIASVIYNRLNNPKVTNGMLQIDATIAYRTGRKVTTEDTQSFNDSYNTYLNEGLPPGPISNPGSVAIRAALYPNSTKYYYYALGDDGVHHFFRTYKEQTAFKATQALYGGTDG